VDEEKSPSLGGNRIPAFKPIALRYTD
jgi:hypothetical protein